MPSTTAHHIDRMRREYTMIATTTAAEMTENTQVMFTANENAAPGFRTYRNCNAPPRTGTGVPYGRFATTSVLATWSNATTTTAAKASAAIARTLTFARDAGRDNVSCRSPAPKPAPG